MQSIQKVLKITSNGSVFSSSWLLQYSNFYVSSNYFVLQYFLRVFALKTTRDEQELH